MTNKFISNIKSGYTLAEALITIAIIGALAAISMPMLHNMLPDKYDAMYKKASYALEHTTSDIVNDDFLYAEQRTYTPNCLKGADGKCIESPSNAKTNCCIDHTKYDTVKWDRCEVSGSATCATKYGVPDGTYQTNVQYGLKNLEKVNVAGINYSGTTKFCSLFASKFNLFPNTEVKCTNASGRGFYNDNKVPTFVSNDGIQWLIPDSDFSSGQVIAFKVSIKGDSKAPNCLNIPNSFWSAYGSKYIQPFAAAKGWSLLSKERSKISGTKTYYARGNESYCKHPDTFIYILTPEGKLVKPEALNEKIKSAN